MAIAPVNWGPSNTGCPPSVFRRYIIRNQARGLGTIDRGEETTEPLYIVCSGPSLRHTWRELVPKRGTIWALNAAFDFLCKKGIRPDYGVAIACEEAILRYFQQIVAGDKFLFALQTHPKLVDRALERSADVTFWNPAHPDGWDMPTPRRNLVYGGGTVGSRAFDLAWILGYRDIHVLGMDACISDDNMIAADIPMYDEHRKNLRTFIVNGRAFVAMPSHAHQVEDFASLIRPLTGMTVTLYGDGMLQWSQQQEFA